MNAKLGLIGKNIQHSKSQEIYEDLLRKKIQYDLFDIENSSDLPDLKNLLRNLDGVSITAPFKESYIDQIDFLETPLEIVNTLKLKEDQIYATNTDFSAVVDVLQFYLVEKNIEKILLLGDGAMAKVTIKALEQIDKTFKQYSRGLGNLLDAKSEVGGDFLTLVINTCARGYVFEPPKHEDYFFWDMNYNYEDHEKLFLNTKVRYEDGLGLLRRQAKYALSFWNLD